MILLIDNYDSFTYNLYQNVTKFYKDVQVVRNDKITVKQILKSKPSGIILSPGPGRPEKAGICIDLVRSLDNSIPLLGVCLGHQALAIAFAGQVIQAQEIVHGKPELIFHARKGIYQQLPLPFAAGRYHSLIVNHENLPETLIVEAINPAGLIMGIRHRQLPFYGVQFHPESILTPKGELLIENFLKECFFSNKLEIKYDISS